MSDTSTTSAQGPEEPCLQKSFCRFAQRSCSHALAGTVRCCSSQLRPVHMSLCVKYASATAIGSLHKHPIAMIACTLRTVSPMASLQAGYAVIYLARKGCCQPFVNHLPPKESGSDFANFVPLRSDAQTASHDAHAGATTLCPEHVVALAHQVLSDHRLLTVHFTTVFEYLAYLEVIAIALKVCCTILRYLTILLVIPAPSLTLAPKITLP